MRKWLELAGIGAVLAVPVGSCTEAVGPPTTGSLEVTTRTSGEPAGLSYSLQVDGSMRTAVAADGEATANCAPDGALPATVHIGAGVQTTVSVAVRCRATGVGAIQVIVTSSLVNAGAIRSFNAMLDRLQCLPVPVNGSALFSGAAAGSHSVRLAVPPYCAVGGFNRAPNPVTTVVPAAGTAIVRFSVLCIG
jgi:hypothetical protein